MPDPVIARKEPVVLELPPGTSWWCRCGRSRRQPLCDGSHKGTGLEPVKFQISRTRTVALCGCKRTGGPPFCDGTHKTL